MTWREQINHTTNCYFCMVNITGILYKTRSSVQYPDILSVSKPIRHDPVACPVPSAFTEFAVDEEKQEKSREQTSGGKNQFRGIAMKSLYEDQ